jgi:hypothetical protein
MIKKTAFYSNVLMLLTSVHHMYGAYIYHTPWRLHILFFSIPVMVFNWVVVTRRTGTKPVFYIFCAVNLVVTVMLIGVYEGVYNHLLKNILYFTGVPTDTMNRLFPPPVYVMPDDVVFEVTGILQGLVLIPLVYWFVLLFRNRTRS